MEMPYIFWGSLAIMVALGVWQFLRNRARERAVKEAEEKEAANKNAR